MVSLMSSVVSPEGNLDNRMNPDMDNLELRDSTHKASLDMEGRMMLGGRQINLDTGSLVQPQQVRLSVILWCENVLVIYKYRRY